MGVKYLGVMEAIEICDKELDVINKRIEAGEDVRELWREQMRNLKKRKEFYERSKELLLEGRYYEFEILCKSI